MCERTKLVINMINNKNTCNHIAATTMISRLRKIKQINFQTIFKLFPILFKTAESFQSKGTHGFIHVNELRNYSFILTVDAI